MINLNANKFEILIRRFFADARLDIVIMARFKKPFAREIVFRCPFKLLRLPL